MRPFYALRTATLSFKLQRVQGITCPIGQLMAKVTLQKFQYYNVK
jgi:hypothetical protein